jgi:ketosteroid isomerase-like protein
MSEANLELVRRFYAALNAADLEAVVALCDDGVEFVNPDNAAETGTRSGAVAFRQAFERLLADFCDFRSHVVDIEAVGDDVAVAEESTGRGRASDIPFSEVHGHLFTLRDGRIVRFRWFKTVEELRVATSEQLARPRLEGA